MNEEELKFWQEFNSLLKIPQAPEIEYRLYYDISGEIVARSMIKESILEGQYLIVSLEEYENYAEFRVSNKKLIKKDFDAGYQVALKKADTGFKVVKNHASIILYDDEIYQDVEYYERNY